MPYTPIPDGTVTGAWGAGAYPPWFEQIAQQRGMGNGAAKAAAFKNYVTSHPDYDFGEFWNQFRPGGPLANHQFYNPAQGPPPQEDPPPGNPDDAAGGQNNHVQTSRPTQPGSDKPGHWQRLVSFVNGQRRERWEWREDPAAPVTPTPIPAPAPTTPPQTDPPQTVPPTPQQPPIGATDTKPKPNPGGWQGKPTPPIATPPQQVQNTTNNMAGGNLPGNTGNSLVANAFGARTSTGPRPSISPNTQKPWKTRQVPQNPTPQYPLPNQ